MHDGTPKSDAAAAQTKDSRPEEAIPHERIDALEQSLRSRYKYWLGMLQQQRSSQLDEFLQAQQETAALLDRYSAQDDHDRQRRRRALDAYFDLDRLLQKQQEAPRREPRLTGPMLPEHRKRVTQAAEKRRKPMLTGPLPFDMPTGAGLNGKLVILGLMLVLAAGLAIWRLASLYGGPDLDPALAASKVVTPNSKTTGVDAEGKSVAVNKDLVAGVPLVTHLRIFQDKMGNLRARATAISTGGKRPTLSFTWYQGDAPIKEEESGMLDVALVESGKGYAVQVVASNGAKKSRPIRTKQLVAEDKGNRGAP